MTFKVLQHEDLYLRVVQTLDAQSAVILTVNLLEIFPEGETRENCGKT